MICSVGSNGLVMICIAFWRGFLQIPLDLPHRRRMPHPPEPSIHPRSRLLQPPAPPFRPPSPGCELYVFWPPASWLGLHPQSPASTYYSSVVAPSDLGGHQPPAGVRLMISGRLSLFESTGVWSSISGSILHRDSTKLISDGRWERKATEEVKETEKKWILGGERLDEGNGRERLEEKSEEEVNWEGRAT